MVEYRYEYGKRWNALLPRRDLRYFVAHIHCAEPRDYVEAEVRRVCARSKIPARMVPACLRYAQCVFKEQVDIYYRVTRGAF